MHEVPITSITNGVHTKTWMAPEFSALYTKYLGDWEEHLTEHGFLARRDRYSRRAALGDAPETETASGRVCARTGARCARERVGESPESIRNVNRILDPEILTIGFARRFATYKRGALLFSDKERLQRLLNDTTRPVQFIFAGKSHPRDEGGKALIQEVYKFSREAGFENRIVFVEDYDTYIARRLVQGVDLWLNNPLRPLEASGTSGMKLPPNGGLNLSVLDGWWCEGYNGNNGWAIGAEIEDGTVDFQSEVDASSLYQLLENQIIPLYYAKPDGKLPLAWLQLMRESIRSVTPVFNTHRMVKEYTERLYIPAAKAHEEFVRDNCAAADAISANGKRRCARTGRRCAFPMCRSATRIGKIFRSAKRLQVAARRFISAPSIRNMCASKRITAKPTTAAIRNPAVTVLERKQPRRWRRQLHLSGRSARVRKRRLRFQRARRPDASASHANARAAFDHLVVNGAKWQSTFRDNLLLLFQS